MAEEMKESEPPRSGARILDARVEAEKLRTIYKNDPRQSSFRLLITGESGDGKTHLLRTARRPVHVDSFDPGGTKPLRDLVERGHVVADTIYESENREEPTMFREWCRTFESRVRGKYFEAFGTYCLDSSTMWADAIMNHILGKAGKDLAGQAPRWAKDYVPHKMEIRNWMKRILDLPCDVIVTGHLKAEYETKVISGGEEVQSKVGMRYLTTGDGAIVIPLLFDEIWVANATAKGQSVEYKVITAKTGLYQAKTRIGRGVFSTYEVPDIKELLKKAGWAFQDKEKLF